MQRDDIRNYLIPYFEDILSLIVEFIDQARFVDYDFLQLFFTRMLKIKCSLEEIVAFLHELAREKSNLLLRALYCDISKAITDGMTLDINIFAEFLPSLISHLNVTS
jgi:hypothetical protein